MESGREAGEGEAGAHKEGPGDWGMQETAVLKGAQEWAKWVAPGSQHLFGASPEGQRAQLVGVVRRPGLWEGRDSKLLDPERGQQR